MASVVSMRTEMIRAEVCKGIDVVGVTKRSIPWRALKSELVPIGIL